MRPRALCSLLSISLAAMALLGARFLTAAAPGEPVPAAAQQNQQQPLRVQVQLVNLFVTVRDKKKQLITDLTQNDFRVFEDGQEQKVAFFSHETSLPITLGLLIDTSGSEQRMLPAEQEAASRFLGRVLRKGDLAMVMSFDLDVDLLSDFTSDRSRLERAIQRARINAPSTPVTVHGPLPQRGSKGTNFYDAVYLACHEKLAGEAGRKAIVVLTDAVDNGSKVRLEDALEAGQRSDTVVHILLVYDPAYGSSEGVAKKLTEETGGRTIVVHGEKKLEEAFDQISQELRSQYTLGYYPTNTARDGRFRKIKIETTTRKDLQVLARKGYYAPKQ
ncbi:MAG TPA: VWA domain-containing protein [Candidatus Acidoferrales bacterium]|nr:VWA domain-containing protein [Candidatus Acidoferrales bacterium]